MDRGASRIDFGVAKDGKEKMEFIMDSREHNGNCWVIPNCMGVVP